MGNRNCCGSCWERQQEEFGGHHHDESQSEYEIGSTVYTDVEHGRACDFDKTNEGSLLQLLARTRILAESSSEMLTVSQKTEESKEHALTATATAAARAPANTDIISKNEESPCGDDAHVKCKHGTDPKTS